MNNNPNSLYLIKSEEAYQEQSFLFLQNQVFLERQIRKLESLSHYTLHGIGFLSVKEDVPTVQMQDLYDIYLLILEEIVNHKSRLERLLILRDQEEVNHGHLIRGDLYMPQYSIWTAPHMSISPLSELNNEQNQPVELPVSFLKPCQWAPIARPEPSDLRLWPATTTPSPEPTATSVQPK